MKNTQLIKYKSKAFLLFTFLALCNTTLSDELKAVKKWPKDIQDTKFPLILKKNKFPILSGFLKINTPLIRYNSTKTNFKTKIKTYNSEPGEQRLNLLKQVRSYPVITAKRKVLIAGAGLSGLGAAYELMKKGYEVKIFEVDNSHVGGRARTLRFGNGLYGEAGAMRIPTAHKLVREYAKEFGLQLRLFNQSGAFKRTRGVTVKANEDPEDIKIKALYNLTPEESKSRVANFWDKTIQKELSQLSKEELKDLSSLSPKSPKVIALSRRSLYQALVDEGLSQEARLLLGTSWGIETTLPFSLDEHLREEIEGVWMEDLHEIVGGTDRLPTEFSKDMRSVIHSGREVLRIERPTQDKVVVYHKGQGGDVAKEEGDWLVCTLPLGVLSRIEIEPKFSNSKMDAIRRVNYDFATKVLAVTKNRFWELNDGIYGGGTTWDGPLGSTWYPSDNMDKKDLMVSQNPSTLLASYSWGDIAQDMDTVPEKDLHKLVVSELAKVHPILKAHPEYVQYVKRWSWGTYPWSSGAYAFFRPGEHVDYHQALVEPEDRVLLAGEHTSLIHSWMEGALESSLRVADHILKSKNK